MDRLVGWVEGGSKYLQAQMQGPGSSWWRHWCTCGIEDAWDCSVLSDSLTCCTVMVQTLLSSLYRGSLLLSGSDSPVVRSLFLSPTSPVALTPSPLVPNPRVAALESMLEGGHDYSSLAQLTSYQALAATCGAVFAQSAALCGVVSRHLAVKLQGIQQQGDLLYGLQQLLAAACGSNTRSDRGSRGSTAAAPHTPSSSNALHPQHPAKANQAPAPSTTGTAASTFQPSSSFLQHPQAAMNSMDSSISISASPITSCAGSSSTVGAHTAINNSSALAGCSPEPLRCSSSCFDWAAAKQQLVSVLEYETGQYYSALVQAAADRPFKLDPARSITSLMFLVMLSLGVIEACQKLQGAAQAVLGCRGDGSVLGVEATQPLPDQMQQVHAAHAPAANSSHTVGSLHEQQQFVQLGSLASSSTNSTTAQASHTMSTVANRAPAGASSTSTVRVVDGEAALSSAAHRHASAAATTITTITSRSSNNSVAANSSSSSKSQPASSSRPRVSGTRLLLRTFLMVEVGLRIWDALAHQLPAACKSRAGKIGAGCHTNVK